MKHINGMRNNRNFIMQKYVGIKINYHLLTSIYVTSILSYTVLEDDANDEKQSSKLVEAETQGLIM